MKYVDVHCHLNFPDYDKDLLLAIDRAKQAGVGMIVVGTTLATSRRAVELAEQHSNIWAIVGLHPIRVHEESFVLEEFEKLVAHNRVVGVGECGFDFFRPGQASYDDQALVFNQQIDLAVKHKKPLMLHLRSGKAPDENAYRLALNILKARSAELVLISNPGDAHFYAGSKEEALEFLALGFCISFTGVITFTHDYDELVRMVPEDRLLSETDAPFVAPEPHRRGRNEPLYVAHIAHKMAEIRGVSEEVLLPKLVDNACRVFRINF